MLKKWAEADMTVFTYVIILEKTNLTGKLQKNLTVLGNWVELYNPDRWKDMHKKLGCINNCTIASAVQWGFPSEIQLHLQFFM